MGFLDTVRSFVGGRAPVPARPKIGAEYMQGGRGVTMAGWRPALREQDVAVGNAWNDAAARALDTIHNSGWIAGAIEQAVANTVGTGLRLKAMPENNTFGMDNRSAALWAKDVERRFELWSRNPIECDIEGRRNFGQMQAAALRSWFATGEIVQEILWRPRPGSTYGTKVRLIPPHRVPRKSDPIRNTAYGVRMDGDGFPLAYLVTRRDPVTAYETEIEVQARDPYGRPRLNLIFDGMPGQVRGITPLVPALRVARQFDQLADATLMSAIVASVFAATIVADEPTEEVLNGLLTPQEQARLTSEGVSPYDAWFEASAGWYDRATLNVGINGRVAHLFPGQKLEFHAVENPGDNYREFSLHLLREIARCLGITYESATGDYAGVTYSSIRAAVHEAFQITLSRRRHIMSPFCQMAYEAWLEEEIETGRVAFPGGLPAFLANRTAACRAEWRGSPKPQADDLKTAKAHEVYKTMGVITDEMIANDLGVDIEDVYAQRAREMEMRAEYGLPEPQPEPAPGEDMPGEDGDDTQDGEDDDG